MFLKYLFFSKKKGKPKLRFKNFILTFVTSVMYNFGNISEGSGFKHFSNVVVFCRLQMLCNSYCQIKNACAS